MPPEERRTPETSLRDPWVVPPVLAAAVVYLLHGVSGYFERDLGVYAYGAQRLLDGQLPYEGILNRAGPLAHALPAIGAAAARAVGKDDLVGMRLFYMLLAVLSVGVAYYLGRDIFRSKLAGLATATALITFEGFTYYASYGPREKTPMVLFLLVALLALVHRRWATSAVFVSLATLTLQVALPTGAAAMVVCLLLAPRGRLGIIGRYVVGGLAPLVAVVLCYAVAGEVGVFVDGFARLNAQHNLADPFLEAAGNNWSGLVHGFGWSLWVLIIGSVVLLVSAVPALLPARRRERPEAEFVLACTAAWILSAAWALRDFDNWPDAFPFLPSAAVGIGALASVIVRRASWRAATAVITTCCVVGVIVAGVLSWTGRSHHLDEQRASVRAVFDRLPAAATMISFNSPQVMVLAGRTNPTQHQMFSSGLAGHIDESWPGGLAGFIREASKEQPTVVAVQWEQAPRWLTPLLDEYQFVGRGPGWSWYVRTSVPAADRDDIEAAVLAVQMRYEG